MKRLKKAMLLSTLFTLVIGGMFGLNAWRGHRGHRGHRGGWGRRGGVGFGVGLGIGLGHRGYRRGYYGPRRYYGRGRYYDRHHDSQGQTFWEVTNNSGAEIEASSNTENITIAPGETKKLGRDRNFSLSVDGRKITTRNHFIEIDENKRGRIIINTSRR